MYYTPQEVAEITKFKVTTIWTKIRNGTIKATKIGREYRISQEALDKFLKGEQK